MKVGMYLQIAYDHPIVYNKIAKNPNTVKGRGYLILRQLRITTTKNESHDI